MKNEKIISRTNITEIFIAAVLMVSLILVREFEVAGMRLSYKKYAASGSGLSRFSLKAADILASVHSGFSKRRY